MAIKAGLVRGRHEMPVDIYIFDEISNPADIGKLEDIAYAWFDEMFGIGSTTVGRGINQFDYTDVEIFRTSEMLELYVTGLSTALATVLKICAKYGVPTDLYHWDRDTDTYVRQYFC